MAETYTLTYNIGDATGEVPDVEEYGVGETVVLDDGTGLTLEGFVFGGWSLEEDGEPIDGDFEMPAEDTTVFAVWVEEDGEGGDGGDGGDGEGGDGEGDDPEPEPTLYTLTFDGNTGVGDAPEGGKFVEGAKVGLPGIGGVVKEGYVFIGWGLTAGATEVIDGEYTMPGNDATLYVVWITVDAFVAIQRTELKRIIEVCFVLTLARGEDYLEAQYVGQVTADALIRSMRSGKPVVIKYEGFDF